ncbi:MAG TPA: cytochrome ubiquinol oxidase subunit I [Candidatus Brocadiia bacterium]|nr:cytochrome ubiquinol oxidase subunit I [Candidatus Brocadiales bacterium]
MRPDCFQRKLSFLIIIIPLFLLFYVACPALAQDIKDVVKDYRHFPLISSRIAIWVIAELHLMFAAFVLAVPMFVLITEIIGVCTGDEKFDRLSKEFTKLLPVAFSITAIFGAILIVMLIGLYPKFTGYLMEIFSGTMYVYVFLFFGESFTLYAYYYTWDRMKDSRVTKWGHVTIGVFLNLFGTALMFLANAWVCFMMSPGGIDENTYALTSLWGAVHNPLWWPINVHRIIANVAFGGAIAAAYSAFKFLGSKGPDEKAHYDWMAYIGNFIATFALIPLPFAGYYLAFEIRKYDFALITILMGGSFAWLFIIQAVLIGVLFISTNYYLWTGMNKIPGAERYKKFIIFMLTMVFIGIAVWMTPHTMVASIEEARKMGAAHHPLLDFFGQMPAKNTAVNLVILTTFLSFVLYRRANKVATATWRHVGGALQIFMFAGAAITVLYFGISSFPPTPKDIAIRYSIYQVLPVIGCIIGVMGIDIPLFKKSKPLGGIRWGEMPVRSQYILFLIAITFTLLMGLMGFVRSGIRGPWHVYGVMKDASEAAFTPTLGFATTVISIVTVIFFGFIAFVFWLSQFGGTRKE